MAYPFGPAPTLGEVIERAKAYGAKVKYTAVIEGPDGPIRFAYLWIDSERFVDVPDMSYDEPLAPDKVDQLARRLKISTDVFWPGFRGFGNEDDGEEC